MRIALFIVLDIVWFALSAVIGFIAGIFYYGLPVGGFPW